MKVYNSCISKTGIKNVRSWLFQIAHNTIVDNYRRQSKFSVQSSFKDLSEEGENFAFEEALNYILPMLDFIPKEYAKVLKMAEVDGMKQADIAKELNLNLSTTKSRIQKARQLLKIEFVNCCHFETDVTGNIISFEIKDHCKPLQKIKQELNK